MVQEAQTTAATPRRAKGEVAGIKWDGPASDTIDGAPSNVMLWEHCLEIAVVDGNYEQVGRLVGVKPASVAMACCRPSRGGQWPESMLPGGVNYAEVYKAKLREKTVERQKQKPKKQLPVKPQVVPMVDPNDRTQSHATVIPRREVYKYMEDPVVWCKEKHPFIESKKYGRMVIEPWDFQKEIMRDVMAGGVHLYKKSRQVAVTTPIAVAWGHAMLYQYTVHGKPFHGHIFANKESKAIDMAKKARLAIWTAELEPAERACLVSCDPTLLKVPNMYYREAGADNHIMAHTTTKVDVRGYDVNAVLIDEADFIDELEALWESCIGATETSDYLSCVSTLNRHVVGTTFRSMCGEAEDRGWHYMPIDWRANPERLGDDDGETWRAEQIKRMGELVFSVEHELKDKSAGSAMINIGTLRRCAARWQYAGGEPQAGHRYAKGIDIGRQSEGSDPTVFIVIDITRRPGQVVFERNLREAPFEALPGEEPIATLKRAIETMDAEWPGMTFVDCTNDRAFVATLKLAHKVPVYTTSGAGDKRAYDAGSGMRIRSKSRTIMADDFTMALDSGELVVFEKHTPRLWKALETARYPKVKTQGENVGNVQKTGKAKRQGENADEWDAAMLARLGMGRVKGMGRAVSGRDDGAVEEEVEQRREVKTLSMPSPREKANTTRGSIALWRPGMKF